MKSHLIAIGFVGLLTCAFACGTINPCGAGQEPCGGGCMPAGNVCCGASGNCPSGFSCGAGGTCLGPVSGCAASGQETCTNFDGIADCAPLGAACCGNHHWCPVGTVCNASGTGCVQ